MSRLSLSILAALACAMAITPPAASAQDSTPVPAQSSTAALAPFHLASTSSSSTSASDSSDGSSLVIAPPAPKVESENPGGPFSGIAVGLRLGLAGVGFDVATPIIPQRLNLRGGASFLSLNPGTFNIDGVNADGSAKFQNADIMADFFPFHRGLRLSGGMTIYNNTGFSAALSVPQGQSISVGSGNYYSDPSAPLMGNAAVSFGGRTAGRVSIGTGNMLPKRGHLTFETEIGVQFFSQPTVNYTFTGQGCQTDTGGVYTDCGPIPQDNITSEQQKLQNDINELRYFPVVSFGISYRIH